MTAPEDAIRARRRLTNKLIATHDAARLRPFLDPAVNLIAGDGSLIVGADAVLKAFEASFREPGFGAYLRTTETVALDQAGQRAAETGRWLGTWKRDGAEARMWGSYLAAWKKIHGQWVIESELYITLGEGA
ncbi:MAG: nuclear transport factor 2 family protein [Caulobacteraceae bacterium]